MLAECVNSVTLSACCVMLRLCLVIIFDLIMKANYMITQVPAQWKAPWRLPRIDIWPNEEESAGNLKHNKFQHKLGETVKRVQDFIKKHWLQDRQEKKLC